MRSLLSLAMVLVACTRREAPIVAVNENAPDATAEPHALPHVRTKADVEADHGRRVVVEGVYEVEPLQPIGKKAQFVSIVLVDGTRVLRAYAPVAAELALVGRKVLATGTITRGPPDPLLQAVGGPHLKTEQVELATGETPIAPAPTQVPTPPMASTSPPLATELDRWVALVGDVETVKPTSIALVVEATLRLVDGTVVRVPWASEKAWTPLVGKRVTAIGRLEADKTDAAFGLDLVLRGPPSVCLGVVPRCGM